MNRKVNLPPEAFRAWERAGLLDSDNAISMKNFTPPFAAAYSLGNEQSPGSVAFRADGIDESMSLQEALAAGQLPETRFRELCEQNFWASSTDVKDRPISLGFLGNQIWAGLIHEAMSRQAKKIGVLMLHTIEPTLGAGDSRKFTIAAWDNGSRMDEAQMLSLLRGIYNSTSNYSSEGVAGYRKARIKNPPIFDFLTAANYTLGALGGNVTIAQDSQARTIAPDILARRPFRLISPVRPIRRIEGTVRAFSVPIRQVP